jgi:hypothetical protein
MAAILATVTTKVLSLGYKSQRRNRRQGREKRTKGGGEDNKT